MAEFVKSGTIDFTGGLNTRTDQANLNQSQFSEFRNITLYKKTLKKRDGSSRQARITKQISDQFTGTQYIRIPHHNDYNTYHVYSAYEQLSIYFEIQCRFSYSASSIIPILYKKNSFLLYINTDNKVKLYWKDRGVNTLITSPYLLSDLAPLTSSSGFVCLGIEFTNTSGDNIKLYANGMKITDHDENGSLTLNTHIWDDYNVVSAGNIYLGYYDGVDYSAAGLSTEKYFTGDMWEFRIWRGDSNTNFDPALSDSNKKRYCFGALPASMITDTALKGYWPLGDDGTTVVQDSDGNANDGFWVGPVNSRSPKYQGNINARGAFQLRRQTGSDISLIDGGQILYQDFGTNEWLPIWRRDPDRISADQSITVSYTYLPEQVIYNSRMYFATGEEKPYKHDGTICDFMGIAAPVGAPTLDATWTPTVGILNATYSWRYTYYNSSQGIESNASPAYTASPANQQLWLDFDRPKDRQVDKIRIYRTKAGGTVYYFLKEIDAFISYEYNTTDIIWNDNFNDATLNTSIVMPTTNATPPQAKYIAEHHDRIFLAGNTSATSTLYYSEASIPESFPSANTIEIGTTFEGDITGLNYSRGRLYIFKEKAIWYLYGTSPEDFFTDYISREIGCTVPRSRMLINEMIFFASSDGIYVIEGASGKITPISEQIKPTYLTLNHAQNTKWQAVHNKKYNQYILFCTSSGSTINDIALVYDYNVNAWAIWDVYADAAGEFFESQQDEVYTVNDAAGSTEIVLFKQNSGNSDGISINSPFREPTAFGSDWIEDSEKIFAWTANSFVGCPLYLINYVTGTVQKRIITANTTSRITVSSAFSPSLSAVYRYAIGGIYMHVETGWMDIGEPQRFKRYQMVDLLFNPVTESTATIGSRVVTTSPLEMPQIASAIDYESTFSKYRYFDLTESDGHVRWSISRRGRHMKIRFLSPAPNTPVEIAKIVYGSEYKNIR